MTCGPDDRRRGSWRVIDTLYVARVPGKRIPEERQERGMAPIGYRKSVGSRHPHSIQNVGVLETRNVTFENQVNYLPFNANRLKQTNILYKLLLVFIQKACVKAV